MSEGKKPSDDVSSLRHAASERLTSIDPRAHAAWRTWLAVLAKDADAATAAALAYQALPSDGRDAWLDALDVDAPQIRVPKIALYAPLLGVEQDETRRERIVKHVEGAARKSTPPRALVGQRDQEKVCVIVSPLYLDFVELLVCRYDPREGIRDARHEWLAHTDEVAACARELEVKFEEASLREIVEDLAHAVVADRRAGRKSPEALERYIDLFVPDLPSDPGISE